MKKSFAVLLAVCFSATSLFAAQPANRQGGEETRITVSVDANGNLRQSTVQEQLALTPKTVVPTIMRMPVAMSNGSVLAPVDESFDHLFVARTDADGNIVVVCTDDHEAMAEISSSSVDTVLRLKTKALVKRMNAERE